MRERQLSSTQAEETRVCQTVCWHGVHKLDATGQGLSRANISHRTAKIAKIHNLLAGSVVICYGVLNFGVSRLTGA